MANEKTAAETSSQTPTQEDVWAAISVERLRLADELTGLTAEQWETKSQCDAWTVRDVAAHLVTPFEMSTPKFVFTLIKNRTNFDKTMIELTAGTAARFSTEEIIELLRVNAENRWTPPGKGPEIPLGEVVVHGQDIRRVLGLANPVPADIIALTLHETDDVDVRADYKMRIGG